MCQQDDLKPIYLSEYYRNSEKFIFIGVDMKLSDLNEVFKKFNELKILNFIVILTTGNNFEVISYNPFFQTVSNVDESLTDVNAVFPDKLLDLNDYEYKIIFSLDVPRIQFRYKTFDAQDYELLKVIAKKQNARLKLSIEMFPTGKNLNNHLITGTSDICLNTDFFDHATRSRFMMRFNTFDTDGYCVIVPHPKRKTAFGFLFEPFDLWTWILLVGSMVCCAVVWHYLKRSSSLNSNSSGYFMFGFISNFLGQRIPFRDHRPMQKLILQLTILLTFILGTAYQSLLISMIADPRYGTKITTIDELISSNYSFYADPVFRSHLRSSNQYSKIESRIVGYLTFDDFSFKKFSSENIAIIQLCSRLNYILSGLLDKVTVENEATEFYYMLDAKFSTFYLNLPVSRFSYFQQRLQELSLRIFESGIRQRWTAKNPFEDAQARKEREYYENEEYFLNLKDLTPAFYLLVLGLTFSAIYFLLEIFWRDFLKKFIKDKSTRRVNNIAPKKRTFRVKFVKVRPIN